MSNSVRPHRRQPTRLTRPWDSPGKNTGVDCHFLLPCMKVKSESEIAQSCPTLQRPHGLQPTRLLCPWDFPGKSTGVGCHRLLWGSILDRAKDNMQNLKDIIWKFKLIATILYCWPYSCLISNFDISYSSFMIENGINYSGTSVVQKCRNS